MMIFTLAKSVQVNFRNNRKGCYSGRAQVMPG